jgi:hypothetical protein
VRRVRLLILLGAAVCPTSVWSAEAAADPVIAAAGDIACSPSDPNFNDGSGTSTHCRQRATSNLLVDAGLAAVLPLGDLQYENGLLEDFNAVYDPTWGRVKSITRPTLGNHEGGGTGYFDYFNGIGVPNGPAGERGKGYYSFDAGDWHLIALNSNCSRGPCAAGSEQERWLRADLDAHLTRCTLAYWHHPRYTSGHGGSGEFMQPLWEVLYDAGVEIALTAHSHHYEVFAPIGRDGALEPGRGIRQFVVGTGGAHFTGLLTRLPGSEVIQNHTFGVLELTLHPTSYSWRFVPRRGETFSDSGSGTCHEGSLVGIRPSGPVVEAPAPGSGPGPASGPGPSVVSKRRGSLVRLSRRSALVGRRGIAALRVRCLASSRCRGTLRVAGPRRGRHRPAFGRARFSIAPGRSELVRVKLSRIGRERVRRAGRLRCRASFAIRVAGRPFAARVPLVLRARR